jgi:quercetin dioxygenase-like cupin family protein
MPRQPPPVTRKSKIVVQTVDARVVGYALEPDERHPWHYHSRVSDRFYCLEGLIAVDTRTAKKQLVLRPGESCEILPKTVHRVIYRTQRQSLLSRIRARAAGAE